MITLDRVSKVYRTRSGRKTVLDNVSATFESGQNFGVLGVNGAGKSTLLRLIAGSEIPDLGVVRRNARVSFPLGFGGTFHGGARRRGWCCALLITANSAATLPQTPRISTNIDSYSMANAPKFTAPDFLSS
jgi:ABC-type cobalamin/Fe3+-siderophores transport system ATPase subunit